MMTVNTLADGRSRDAHILSGGYKRLRILRDAVHRRCEMPSRQHAEGVKTVFTFLSRQ